MYDPSLKRAGPGKGSSRATRNTPGSGRAISLARHGRSAGSSTTRVGVSAARERGASARARITAAIACVSPEATAGRGIF